MHYAMSFIRQQTRREFWLPTAEREFRLIPPSTDGSPCDAFEAELNSQIHPMQSQFESGFRLVLGLSLLHARCACGSRQ